MATGVADLFIRCRTLPLGVRTGFAHRASVPHFDGFLVAAEFGFAHLCFIRVGVTELGVLLEWLSHGGLEREWRYGVHFQQ
jgi:hypothetical protein